MTQCSCRKSSAVHALQLCCISASTGSFEHNLNPGFTLCAQHKQVRQASKASTGQAVQRCQASEVSTEPTACWSCYNCLTMAYVHASQRARDLMPSRNTKMTDTATQQTTTLRQLACDMPGQAARLRLHQALGTHLTWSKQSSAYPVHVQTPIDSKIDTPHLFMTHQSLNATKETAHNTDDHGDYQTHLKTLAPHFLLQRA